MNTQNTFDNEAGIYEQTSRQVNIHYDEALAKMLDFMPNTPSNILDVCCGTGILTQLVSNKFPSANICGIDFSSGMLNVAKERFKNKNYIFHNFDLLDKEKINSIDDKFDLVVSSFGIHNIHSKEKKVEALQNIATLMKSGSTFITCDILKGDNEEEQLSYYNVQKNHLLKSFNEKETQDWLTLLDEEDDPEKWQDNQEILKLAGLTNAQLLWKKDFLAIWKAEKV